MIRAVPVSARGRKLSLAVLAARELRSFDPDLDNRPGVGNFGRWLGLRMREANMMRRRDVLRALVASGVMIRGFPVAAAPTGRVIVSKLALVAGRVVMGLTIDGAGPYLFMIDTGGHLSMIDEALARSLKLAPQGMTRASGVGGVATLPVFLAHHVVFGGGPGQPEGAFP